jgi:hypothetical protein
MNAPQYVSYTPTAVAEPLATPEEQHHCSLLASLQGLLEPVAWKAGTAGSDPNPRVSVSGSSRPPEDRF